MSKKNLVPSGSHMTNGSRAMKFEKYSFHKAIEVLSEACESARSLPVNVQTVNATCNCIGKMMTVVNTAQRIGAGNSKSKKLLPLR